MHQLVFQLNCVVDSLDDQVVDVIIDSSFEYPHDVVLVSRVNVYGKPTSLGKIEVDKVLVDKAILDRD